MSGTQSQDQASTAVSANHTDMVFGSNGSIGALFTWHSDLRIESPMFNSSVSHGASVEQLTAVARSMDHVRQHFVNFAQQVKQWADKASLPVFAACMELCTQGDSDSRVHLHAFLSIAPDFISGSRSGPLVRLGYADLMWFGYQPNVVHMKKSGRSNVSKMVAGGLYYVLSAKVGTIHRSGNFWPFEAWPLTALLGVAPSGRVLGGLDRSRSIGLSGPSGLCSRHSPCAGPGRSR